MVTTITIVSRRFFISRLSCCNLSDFTEVHVALTLLLQSYLLTSGLNIPVWMHMSPVSSLHWSPSLLPAVLCDCSIWPPPTLSTSYRLQYPRPPIIFTNAPKSMQGFLADHLIHLSSPKDPFFAQSSSPCHAPLLQPFSSFPSFGTTRKPHCTLYFCKVSEESSLLRELGYMQQITITRSS